MVTKYELSQCHVALSREASTAAGVIITGYSETACVEVVKEDENRMILSRLSLVDGA